MELTRAELRCRGPFPWSRGGPSLCVLFHRGQTWYGISLALFEQEDWKRRIPAMSLYAGWLHFHGYVSGKAFERERTLFCTYIWEEDIYLLIQNHRNLRKQVNWWPKPQWQLVIKMYFSANLPNCLCLVDQKRLKFQESGQILLAAWYGISLFLVLVLFFSDYRHKNNFIFQGGNIFPLWSRIRALQYCSTTPGRLIRTCWQSKARTEALKVVDMTIERSQIAFSRSATPIQAQKSLEKACP